MSLLTLLKPPLIDLSSSVSHIEKKFVYKIYTKSSSEWDTMKWDVDPWSTGNELGLVGIWRNEVLSDPTFTQVINGGDSEILVRLARSFDNFGEGKDIVLNNKVYLYVYDREAPNGKLLYRGYISGYMPTLDGEKEYLQVRVRGMISTLNDRILRDSSGNTTIAYNSWDPSDIFKDIIDKFRTNDNGQIGYETADIETTNTTVSYTFNTNTYREALDKVVELAPEGWYWRVEPNGNASFKAKSNQVTHQISTKKHIAYLSPEKNIEDFYNEVYLIGGDTGGGTNLYLKSSNATSVDDYARHVKRINDGRVTVQSTGEIMINRVLDEKSSPVRRTVVRIVDSNGRDNSGYDIESIQVGETINIGELTGAVPSPTKWDVAVWDSSVWDNLKQNDPRDIMQVVSRTYSPDMLEIEATTRLPKISKRVEDIKRNVDSLLVSKNPSAPTEV